MDTKILTFMQIKKECNVTDLLAEFLISFEELFPILCKLYNANMIKQKGDQGLVYIGKKSEFMNSETKIKSKKDDEKDDFFDWADIEDEEIVDDETIEKIIYEEIFNDQNSSREDAILAVEKSSYIKEVKEKLVNKIKSVTEEQIEMFKTGERCPKLKFYKDDGLFENKVKETIERIILNKMNQTRKEAIDFAKELLEEAKKSFDDAMVDVCTRAYYELRIASEEEYEELKKQLFS